MRLTTNSTNPPAPQRSFADPSERALAQELRGIGVGVAEVPEWKQQALGKAPTFGIRDNRSIKDQRESLPIFKLREQLVQAVMDNQVCWGCWVGAGWVGGSTKCACLFCV